MVTNIHNIFKYNESSSLGLRFITYTDLANLTITSEELIQIIPGDLIVEVFHKKNTVSSWREFGLMTLLDTTKCGR